MEHAGGATGIERIGHYDEYPGDPRAETALADLLASMGIGGQIGADQDGYPWILGYQGPSLSELTGSEVVRVVPFVEAQMAVKSEAELALIRESSKWGNLAHRLLQQYTRPGLTETEVTQRASDEATTAMLQTLGSLYRGQNPHTRGRAPATAARSGAAPPSRTRSRTTSSSRPVTCSSPVRAPRCGATSRSSSGRW